MPWRLEQGRQVVLAQIGYGGVYVRYRFRPDADVVCPWPVIVVVDIFGLALEPEAGAVLATHAEHDRVVVDRLPAQKRHQIPIKGHVLGAHIDLDVGKASVHAASPS